MPSTLANFTLSAAAAPDDFIVGYDEAVLNGERRWSVSTIANAVSGVMKTQLNNDISSSTSVTILSATLSASPITAKAWVNFNGTGTIGASQTIRSNYNVSSVTKTGTGNYILNFSTAFSNTSYAVVMGSSFNSSTGIGWLAFQDDRLGTKTVSQYYLATTDGVVYRDSPEISIAVFFN